VYDVPLFFRDWHYAKPLALSDDEHVFKSGDGFEFGQRDDPWEFGDELDITKQPAGVVFRALRVEIMARRIELSGVWIGVSDNSHSSDDAAWISVRVVEEGEVAIAHFIAEVVPDYVVAAAFPHLRLARFHEVVDAVSVGLRLHQPIAHSGILLTASGYG
jgi:hypothetical protein